jgi:hypothetical protein
MIDSECAYREYVVAQLAQRLGIRLAEVVAVQCESRVVSLRLGCLTYGLECVLQYDQLRDLAMPKLDEYAGIIALDALVGAADREKCWHHIYSYDLSAWYSIDYGYSFSNGLDHFLTGAGDPMSEYGAKYPSAVLHAMKAAPRGIGDALMRAAALADIAIVLDSVPKELRPAESVVSLYRTFLTRRQPVLRDRVLAWCEKNGIALEGA